jgi:primosomal protein N' (replication factor Y) (superfamily II helicase)
MKAKAPKKSSSSWLIEVSLVSHSPFETELSYFSSQRLKRGQLVKVPIRSKLVLAVVLSAKTVRQAKSLIKTARFSMRKIRAVDILEAEISSATLSALEQTALYYGTHVGTLLASLWPKSISDQAQKLLGQKRSKKKRQEHLEKILLQMENEERYSQYRALIRQSFAQGQSVMLVIPTHLEIEKVYNQVSRGISEYVYTFTLESSKKVVFKTWQDAQAEKHPILFLTTPAGSMFKREDLGMIIVERLSSRAYRTFTRPFLDYRLFLETLAKEENYQLVLGDSILPLETLWRE